MAANATRPDPIQISYVFQQQAKQAGLDYKLAIDDIIAAFQGQSSTLEHKKLSPNEEAIVRLWPTLDPITQAMIELHWHTYPNQKSALPLHDLAHPVLVHGSKPRPAQESPLFINVMAKS